MKVVLRIHTYRKLTMNPTHQFRHETLHFDVHMKTIDPKK